MKRQTILLYTDILPHLLTLTLEERGEIITEILQYATTGEAKTLTNGAANMLLSVIIQKMDNNTEKYAEIVERRRIAGAKGAAKRWGERSQGMANDSKNSKCYKRMAKIASDSKNSYTDTETDTDTVIPPYVGIDKEKSTDVDSKKTGCRFSRPSVEDVSEYIAENGYMVDAGHFIDYYEANGWKVGRNPMRDWRAAVRTWQQREQADNRTRRTAGKPQQSNGVTLGYDERIEPDGRRTYGTGKATIPPDAPPRPSERYAWDSSTQKWILL